MRRLAAALLAGFVATGVVSAQGAAGASAKPWLPPLNQQGAVIWAVGDSADGEARSQGLGSMLSATRLDRFLYLGDVYETGTAAEFTRNYAPALGPLASRTAPTIGNHEYANRASGYLPYWERVRGRRPPAWYAISASGWQIIALDSNAARGPGSPQVRWLKRELRRTKKFGSCRIAFTHNPRHSAGDHGDDPTIATLWSALTGRASMLVAGHDHNYQRFRPVDGIVEIVAGSGGRARTPVGTDSRLASYDAEHTGALRVRLRGKTAALSFVSADGEKLDGSRVGCRR